MTDREQARTAARRLAIIRHAQEVIGNVAFTCRYYGVSRQLYYTWLRRYEQQGVDGLRPRSRRRSSPNATTGEVVGKIVYLRKTYHFGPQKISMYLKRYHDIWQSRSIPTSTARRCGLSSASRSTSRTRRSGPFGGSGGPLPRVEWGSPEATRSRVGGGDPT